MAQRKISDTVARLIALSRPAYVDGRWQKPAISNTELRLLRRRLVLSGEYWPPKPLRNIGADPPIKPTQRELNRPARLAAIEENMRMMPKMIEEYRARCREARRLLKEKKTDTEEQAYLKATGKIRQQHEWEKNRDKKKKKKKFAKKN